MLLALVALHLVVGSVVPAFSQRLGTRAFLVAATAPALSTAWLLAQAPTILAGTTLSARVPWISSLNLAVSVRMGVLQWLMALVVTSIGTLVMIYSRWYFQPGRSTTRCVALLTWFAAVMLLLVSADDLVLLYVAWELTSVLSYLLIGHNHARQSNRAAALSALMVTTAGGLAMLTGIVMLWVSTGTLSLARLATHPPHGTAMTVACLLILLGALSKSALVPFHFWLPGAMAAPTPVSAYLHAAAMVKAGVYLVAALAPVYAAVPGWRTMLGLLGTATLLIGGWRSLRQTDLKLVLAYGTVSQLGLMVMLVGLGTRSAALAGIALTLAHALFKSALFLSVGVIDTVTGSRDLTVLSGVGRQHRVLAATMLLAAASMAGLPPTLGFVSKESAFAALTALVARGDGTGLPPAVAAVALVGVVVGSALTVAYSLRLVWGALATKPAAQTTPSRPSAPVMVAVPAVLAAAGLLGGLAASGIGHVIEPYAASVPLGYADAHLALWHGVGPELAASLLAVAGGAALFLGRDDVARLQSTFPSVVAAEAVYRRVVRGVERAGVEVTSRLQVGSLPVYVSVIFGVVVASVGAPVLLTRSWPDQVLPAESLAQAAVVVVAGAAGVGAAASRGRLRAIVLVGVTGYATAMLFAMHAAPDLALTQVLVETVTLVVFLLLVRRMPRYFTDRPLLDTRWWRAALAVCTGLVVTGLALVVPGLRVATPASVPLTRSALEFGYGSNIVNVVLVDTRAWDTIGEISVLVIAATGVASMIFLRTRHAAPVAGGTGRGRRRAAAGPGRAPVHGGGGSEPGTWLRGSRALLPTARSLQLEVITRLGFGVMMVVSVWLLVRGHNAPGGGFAAGLVAGAGLITRYLAGGDAELEEAAPLEAGRLLGLGLLVATGSALVPLAFGGTVLQSAQVTIHLLGEDVHLVSSALFDLGVYLVVIGVVLDYVRSLGAGIDAQARSRRAPVPLPASTVTEPGAVTAALPVTAPPPLAPPLARAESGRRATPSAQGTDAPVTRHGRRSSG